MSITAPSAFLRTPQGRKATALALTATLSFMVLTLSLTPLRTPPPVPGTDKLHHLIAYAALVLPAAALHPRALIWVLPLAVGLGGLIEIVQPYVNRVGEWADFIAGLKGVAIGLGLGLILSGAIAARRRAMRP